MCPHEDRTTRHPVFPVLSPLLGLALALALVSALALALVPAAVSVCLCLVVVVVVVVVPLLPRLRRGERVCRQVTPPLPPTPVGRWLVGWLSEKRKR